MTICLTWKVYCFRLHSLIDNRSCFNMRMHWQIELIVFELFFGIKPYRCKILSIEPVVQFTKCFKGLLLCIVLHEYSHFLLLFTFNLWQEHVPVLYLPKRWTFFFQLLFYIVCQLFNLNQVNEGDYFCGSDVMCH